MVEESDCSSFHPVLPLAEEVHSISSFTPTELDSPTSKRNHSRSRSPKGKDSSNEAETTVPLSSKTDVPHTEDDELFYPGYQLNDSSGSASQTGYGCTMTIMRKLKFQWLLPE